VESAMLVEKMMLASDLLLGCKLLSIEDLVRDATPDRCALP
jgi:hypothetical protein